MASKRFSENLRDGLKPKIALIIDYFQPQLGYFETHVARQFQALHYDVQIFTSNLYFPYPNYDQTVKKVLGPRKRVVGKFVEEGLPVQRLPQRFELFARTYIPGLAEAVTSFKPDMILVNGCVTITILQMIKLSKALGVPVVVWDSQHFSIMNQGLTIKRLFYGLFKTLFAGKINAGITAAFGISKETTEIIATIYGYDPCYIHHISLGTDTNLFQPSAEMRRQMREKYKIQPDEIVFIYTGKLIAEKGPHLITHAFSSLTVGLSKTKIILVGNGREDYLNRIKAPLSPHERNNNLILLPAVPMRELPGYYSMADVGIWPLQESTSMLDAAAMALPIIIDAECGVQDRISQENGLAYVDGSSGLAQQMAFFINNPAVIASYGARGRDLMKNRYGWPIICQQILKLFTGSS